MTDFTLRQLQYFVAAVETGSITEAAERCHASQGAASMAITQLERAVGTELLVRSGPRAAVATPAGREFLVHARAILERTEEAQDAVSESLTELRGIVRIGVGLTLSPRLVPQIAGHFTTHHPQVQVLLQERPPRELEEQVLAGQLDVAFLYRLQTSTNLTVTDLAPVWLHVILPAGHRLAGESRVRLQDLTGEPAILLDVPPTKDRMLSLARSLDVELDVRWTSSTMETIRSMVAAGLGFSFAQSLPATGTTYSGGAVVYRPLADEVAANTIVALTLPGRIPRRVQAAIDLVASAESGTSGESAESAGPGDPVRTG